LSQIDFIGFGREKNEGDCCSDLIPRAPVAEAASSVGGGGSAEIETLNQRIAKMQAEIDGLKKQLTQIVTFINQKLK